MTSRQPSTRRQAMRIGSRLGVGYARALLVTARHLGELNRLRKDIRINPELALVTCDSSVWACARWRAVAARALVRTAGRQLTIASAMGRHAFVIPCLTCGRPVEAARRCYAHPTCYACLPPPPPLGVVAVGGGER